MLFDLQHTAIHAADPGSLHTQSLYVGHQILVDLSQHHLRDLNSLFIRHTQSAYELRLLAGLVHPATDFLAAAVHDDGSESYQLQQNDILYDLPLQLFIYHSTSTVLYNYYFIVKSSYIWKCFDQHLRFF